MANKKLNDNTNVSDSLHKEAVELGIEPSGYDNSENLQARVDQVRAEKEAVTKGQPNLADEADEETTDAGVMNTNNTPSNKQDR